MRRGRAGFAAGFAVTVVLAAGPGLPGGPPAEPAADLILRGGRVWTGELDAPRAEALAIRGARIVAVGSVRDVDALRGPGTEVIETSGRLVLPGFNDAHIHLVDGALSLERVDLIEEASLEAVQARIKAFAAANPSRPWVLGRGWLYGSFPGGLPTRDQLDAIVPDRPAYMECYDGHTGWVNSKALALTGITRDTKNPPNGEIVRDARTGEPTGALKEEARALVEARIPAPDEEQRYGLLLRALRLLNSQGITSVQDARTTSTTLGDDLRLLARAKNEGRLTVRVSACARISPGNVDAEIAEAVRLGAEHHDDLLRVGAVKAFVDGVVEAKTAAMLEPYPGGGTGLPNWTPEALESAAVKADAAGLQVWLHAIGDRGVRMALNAHEAARRANGVRDRRGRVEHIETISPADYPRFAALGVIASMQPLHANPDQNNADVWGKNAGPDRAGRGFGWGNIERAGARLVFGSDWPVVTSDVRRGLFCAVTRRTREGRPPGGWLPEQGVSLPSALRHYTIDGAYASFEDRAKGSIAPGKLADLVVLADDLLASPPETILGTRAVLTIMGGRVVWREGATTTPAP